MATIYKVDCQNRMPLSIGVQEENLAHGIQFDITPWVEEHGAGAVTANAQRPTDAVPYPVIVQQDGNIVTWKPKTADVAIEGTGAFQLIYTVGEVVARTRIWATNIGPSLVGAGDPPDPFDDWLDDMREVAADAQQSANDSAASAQQAAQEVLNAQDEVKNAEAWAVGQRGGVDVPSSDVTYENNAKYYSELAEERTLKAFPVGTSTGSIASFTDGADDIPVKSLTIGIEPKQAGSGTPSPSNVRAITGWTGANVNRRGKNLFVKLASATTDRGVTFTPNADGSVTLTGTSTAAASAEATGYLTAKELGLDPNKTYILTGGNSSIRLGLFAQIGSNIWNSTASGTSFTPSATDKYKLIIYIPSAGIATNTTLYPMIREQSQNADYEPYTATTYPISFSSAGTVYGGEVDVSSGVLTVTHRGTVYNGSENWGAETQGGTTSFYIARQSDAQPIAQVQDGDVFTSICAVTIETWQAGKMRVTSGYYNFLLGSALNISTASQFKTYLASNPISLCYKLATPTEYQLTPTEVRTLLGDNNVWADTGDTEVEYRKDPTLALEELANAIVALGGNL